MKRKIAIITILIVAFIIVGTVFGYSQHRRVEQKEQEKQKKEEYLLSIKDDLYKKIEDNQKYNMKDGSAIYFKRGIGLSGIWMTVTMRIIIMREHMTFIRGRQQNNTS